MRLRPVVLKESEIKNLPSIEDLSVGRLIAKMASTPEDLKAIQRLRYEVFFEEFKIQADNEIHSQKLDCDHYDDFAEHLMVIDQDSNQVVGTYRFLTAENAQKAGGFYSSTEYDLSFLKNYKGNVLELGRSCVHKDYRSRPTLQLLWAAIIIYVKQNNVDLLFGCASFGGSNPENHAMGLSYLYHNHLARSLLRAKALPERSVNMNIYEPHEFDAKQAFLSLPVLLKGYLRVGGKVGEGAVVDLDFNTTDVFIMVESSPIFDRYIRGYDNISKN
jgi:L-ornithine Nalpha-acyltransferase